jgi:hypothetical protein
MLRTIFVFVLVAVGAVYAVQVPLYARFFYIGNAYFRPEQLVWTDLIGTLNLSYPSAAWLLLTALVTRQ